MSERTFPVAVDPDANPAIQLFGNRLFNDQLPIELLIELLLVVSSRKRIGAIADFDTALPAMEDLRAWPEGGSLRYSPQARLNLKLFAFLGASRLDSRHQSHREHYLDLLGGLRERVDVVGGGSEDEVLRTLENLLLGFQGAGAGRTWCAQSFLPVSRGLLAGETIWNETAARRLTPDNWAQVLEKQNYYLSMNKHRFLGRGGEVLYLQVCLALRQDRSRVHHWVEESGVKLGDNEQDPEWLHGQLDTALRNLLDEAPSSLTQIAEFLDAGVDPETPESTDWRNGEPRFVEAGSCASESWQEGYLFAVDLLRLCTANLDLIERLSLLESACALQLLRTLAVQSARHSDDGDAAWPGYCFAVSGLSESNSAVKRISRQSAKVAERLIFHAIRSDAVTAPEDTDTDRAKVYRDADRRYGGKLFTATAKRIGLLIPKRGAGVRFTLNEHLLRTLAVTTVPLGGRITYETFKELVKVRHGLVFDEAGFSRASEWAGGPARISLGTGIDGWVQEMLEAAGLLIQLSDSCALVVNPASRKATAA